jgi:SAM-dependent methyltransferase
MVAETVRLNSSLDGNSQNVDSPECRTCRSTRTVLIGHLPDVYEFAGRMYPRPLMGGSLWRCGVCHFTFRHPIYDEAAYADLYRSGSVQVWESDLRREDLRLVSQRIEHGGFINVLDVGCYTGKLLSMLPSRCKLHGIEINRAAARIAAERGVSIVAHTFEDFEQVDSHFDVIIACDVIEHVVNPMTFLRSLRGHLKTGGQAIITTGDADNWLWRIARSNFWYCFFPEHISFVGRKWLTSMPQQAGFQTSELITFNYSPSWRSPISLLSALIYAKAPSLYRSLRGIAHDHDRERGLVPPPGLGATADHVMCVMTAA